MALIKCPECKKDVSEKAYACPNCGYPIQEIIGSEKNKNNTTDNENSVPPVNKRFLDKIYESEDGKKVFMIKKLREETGCSLEVAKNIIDKYFAENYPEKKLYYTPRKNNTVLKNEQESVGNKNVEHVCEIDKELKRESFSGIYRYTFFGGKQEVYCPRCNSENCSYYQEQRVIPGKTKTKYTANLNPLKPFTLVNKKEKVIRKEEVLTEQKIVCNSCGYIFN